MNDELIVHSIWRKLPMTIVFLICGFLIFVGGSGESFGVMFSGLLIVLTGILLRLRKSNSELRINSMGIKTPEHGLIHWGDVKDLSWTVEEMQGQPPPPKSWRKIIVMYIDVHNSKQYWDRLSWYKKMKHKNDKKAKHYKNRLRTSLKFYDMDQEDIVKAVCRLFYLYKEKRATICYRAQIHPEKEQSFHA